LYDELRGCVQALVAEAVSDACDMLNDIGMDDDDDDEVAMSVRGLKRASRTMLMLLLDPDYGAINLPQYITEAMDEYIDQKVGFQIVR
jgi:hypothetical protein